MPRAPPRAHLRRRRDSHVACSRTRARWPRSYDLVFVSIATAIPVGEIATESTSQRLPDPATAANAAAASLPPQRPERTPHLVLGAGTDATATGECEPMARVETQPDGR